MPFFSSRELFFEKDKIVLNYGRIQMLWLGLTRIRIKYAVKDWGKRQNIVMANPCGILRGIPQGVRRKMKNLSYHNQYSLLVWRGSSMVDCLTSCINSSWSLTIRQILQAKDLILDAWGVLRLRSGLAALRGIDKKTFSPLSEAILKRSALQALRSFFLLSLPVPLNLKAIYPGCLSG